MVEKVRKLIRENCIDEVIEFLKELEESEYDKVIIELIDDLQNTNESDIRNTVAIVLCELSCNDAVVPLVNLISDPRYKNNRGTLVYALEKLDSSKFIVDLFPLLYEGNFEVRMNLYTLVEEKIKEMAQEDVDKCIDILNHQIDEAEISLKMLYDAAEEIFGLHYDEDNSKFIKRLR